MPRHNVMVVDDETKMQRILEIMLEEMDLDVVRANNGAEALDALNGDTVDLIITDMRMPVMDGIDLVRALHDRGTAIPVIVITAYGTVESAVEAMRLGAIDYITRPFEVEAIELAVRRALNLSQVQRENQFLRDTLRMGWEEFIGCSKPMQKMYDFISKVGPSNLPVLIVGETGTGKELVARTIHNESTRGGLFVAINCAGIPETLLETELFGHVRGAFTGATGERAGKFEISDGGTVFLDEITEMPISLQTRLLRVLQENYIERIGSNRRIDLNLRIIAATNRDPVEAVKQGHLREDLFYRLNGFRLDAPALRERDDDICMLAQHFLEIHARKMAKPTLSMSAAAQALLKAYHWPGNVRELENLMAKAILLCDSERDVENLLSHEFSLTAANSLPATEQEEDGRLQQQVDALERKLIKRALTDSADNKAKAARALEISERTLWYKLKKLGLK